MSVFLSEVFLEHSYYLRPGFTSWCVSIDTNKPRSREGRIYYSWQQVRTSGCFPKQCHHPEQQNLGGFKLRAHASSQVALVIKNLLANAGDPGSIPGSGRFPKVGHSNPLVFLPGESHGWKSLVGYSPWGQEVRHDWSDLVHTWACVCIHTHIFLFRRALGQRVHIQEGIWAEENSAWNWGKVNSVQALVDWSQEDQHHHRISNGRGPSVQSIQLLSCVQFCNPRDCSMPGFPVHHQLQDTNSCPYSQWCHPTNTTISSSVIPFSSHLQSFPASGSLVAAELKDVLLCIFLEEPGPCPVFGLLLSGFCGLLW